MINDSKINIFFLLPFFLLQAGVGSAIFCTCSDSSGLQIKNYISIYVGVGTKDLKIKDLRTKDLKDTRTK